MAGIVLASAVWGADGPVVAHLPLVFGRSGELRGALAFPRPKPTLGNEQIDSRSISTEADRQSLLLLYVCSP
jgi:hypothetical protein